MQPTQNSGATFNQNAASILASILDHINSQNNDNGNSTPLSHTYHFTLLEE